MSAADKLIKYVQYDTQSDENSETVPSTEKQLELAAELARECHELGLSHIVEQDGTVYAVLEPNTEEKEHRSVLSPIWIQPPS